MIVAAIFLLGVIAGIGVGVAIERGVDLPPGPLTWRFYLSLSAAAVCSAVLLGTYT